MAQTQTLEHRIDKAAEEILLVAARNGIAIVNMVGNHVLTSPDANETWSRVQQLARLRCRVESSSRGGQQIIEPSSNLPQ